MVFKIPKKSLAHGYGLPPKPKAASRKKQQHPLFSDEEIDKMKEDLIDAIALEKGVPSRVFDRNRTRVKFREDGTPYLQPA